MFLKTSSIIKIFQVLYKYRSVVYNKFKCNLDLKNITFSYTNIVFPNLQFFKFLNFMYIVYKQREAPLELSNKYYVYNNIQNGIYNFNEGILKIWRNTKGFI